MLFYFRIGSNQLEGFRLDFVNALKISKQPKVYVCVVYQVALYFTFTLLYTLLSVCSKIYHLVIFSFIICCLLSQLYFIWFTFVTYCHVYYKASEYHYGFLFNMPVFPGIYGLGVIQCSLHLSIVWPEYTVYVTFQSPIQQLKALKIYSSSRKWKFPTVQVCKKPQLVQYWHQHLYGQFNQPPRLTQPCIPLGSLNRVPASAGVKVGKSPLPGGR